MVAYPKIVVSPPGPKARELVRKDEQFVSPSYLRYYPLVVESAKDCVVKDVDGNEYIDLNAGIACMNVGHNHPRVVEAIKSQCDRFLHYSNTDFYYKEVISLAEKLSGIAPGEFQKKTYFGNSGTESVEAAIKLARWHTRKQMFIGFISGFHGRTMGSLAFTASKPMQRRYFSPFMPGTTQVPYPYCYRCPFKLEKPDCNYWCADFIEEQVLQKYMPPEDVAAILFEPIQGEGGYVVPPPEFFAKLRKIADNYDYAIVPFWAAALIFFREGIEAALVVGALLAALRKLGRADASRFVHFGWLAALPAGVVTWWLFDSALSFGADRRELIEASVALLASAVLFSVSFWMVSKVESRHWMAYLRRNVERSLGGRSLLVLSGLAFLAAYREAAEVVLFTQALLLDAPYAHAQVWAGAAAGAAAVAGVALLASRTVLRLPLGPFFAVSSALLCVLAIGFAGSGMHALVAAGYLAPRPVPFFEVPWMGIHPDLTSLAVQLTIVAIIVTAGIASLRRPAADPASKRR